jgi:hypothetical protein
MATPNSQVCRLREAWFVNGSLFESSSTFDPIPELRVTDSNVVLFFLSADRVLFAGNVTDPWYHATRTANLSGRASIQLDANSPRYTLNKKSEPVSVLGCTQRDQICSPHRPDGECTALASTNDVMLGLESMNGVNDEELDRLVWAMYALRAFNPDASLLPTVVGAQALASRGSLSQNVQGPLPDDQWQKDVQYWFDTGLATLQASLVLTATGPRDSNTRKFALYPNTTAQHSVCQNQVGIHPSCPLQTTC